MSMHRLVSYRLLPRRHTRSSVKSTAGYFIRWQSANASPKRGGGTLKKVLAGFAVTGLAAGGVFAYSNYDPVFKNQVDEKIPGFAAWTDKTADMWVNMRVNMTDYFSPKPGDRQKNESDLVFERNQAKIRQSELKKRKDQDQSTSKTPGMTKPDGSVSTEQLAKGEKVATDKKDPVTTKPKDARGKESLEQLEGEVTEPVTGEVAGWATMSVPAVGSEEVLPDAVQVEVMLDRTYKKFKSDCNQVDAAQEDLVEASMNLVQGSIETFAEMDGTEAEAKTAVSLARQELVAATAEYDVTYQQLKDLAARAPEEGCKAEVAEAILGDIHVQDAKLGFGALFANAVTAGAELLGGPIDSSQEDKQDFEAAASLMKPSSKSKDNRVLSLSKKAELLENQLKTSELEHARYVMLALEVQRRSLEQLAEGKLEETVKEAEAKYQRQLIKEINKLADSYNTMLKQQLQMESESHAKEMSEALRDQADKLISAWSSKVDLQLSDQQGFYQTELAKARSRLFGLESMVDGITSAGEKTLQLQTLRNSCDILTSALNVDSDATDRFTIGTELDAVYRVAGDKPFVTTILNSIPIQAISGVGIQSEASLKERFNKVKRICGRVALVPDTGGGLGLYALSYLQSIFTIRVPLWLSKSPADKDHSELHTYDLLELADAQIKKGDLTGAVYYLNYLQGEPGNIARDWLKDARLYLETRQAIELVQTYMFASGVVTNDKS